MENKVAIVTIFDQTNFGNRLQNYAVSKCMEKLGFKPETIVIKQEKSLKTRMFAVIKKTCSKVFPNYVKKKYPYWLRYEKFSDFTKKYIYTRYIKSKDGTFMQNLSDKYKYFVIGSDQVWNPNFYNDDKQLHNMFLLFTDSQKKICFSPSIGISEIPDEWKEKFTRALRTFPQLNVREKSGAQIISNLIQKEAQVLIDPTLMLDSDEWLSVAEVAPINTEKYVLEYFLGETDERVEQIITSTVGQNVKRVRVLDPNDVEAYVSGPSQFINMIRRASLVCTDSFHACVFSIIFDVPFIIMRRKDANADMYTRIDSLLSLFEVENIAGNPIVIDKNKKILILKRERERVSEYLKKCVGGLN